MKTAQDVLKFWFEDHGQEDWFGAKPEFDALIAAEFGETHAAVARGEAWRWRTTPEGRLAEIVVLDQFSRQLFRGQAEAFASDRMALTLAQEAVAGGHHNFVPMPQRMFMLLPYQHAESVAVQAESVRLHMALGSPELLKFAEGHAACVTRFGRFPKRNAALGRTSTAEEEEYIASTDGMF
ncbi:MAG: DUF924 domain-containing protein [Devosia sp.]|uniref:DUF924 family protein n=1 Tax=Devosia sp. 66-22 TaxID=1895753 RepID=UPI000AD60F0F|nr:DUF924 family protein [Devosia sp. 66-22]MBN9348758.1 DUF924 domain-containing protein [Devosia sp.]